MNRIITMFKIEPYVFCVIIGCLIGAIVSELGGLIGIGIIVAVVGMDFGTGNPVIGMYIGFGICMTYLFIGVIIGGLIGIYIVNNSRNFPRNDQLEDA